MTTTSASAYITPVTSFQTSTSQGSPIVVLSRQSFSRNQIGIYDPSRCSKYVAMPVPAVSRKELVTTSLDSTNDEVRFRIVNSQTEVT